MNKYWFRKRGGLFSGDLGWGFMPSTIEGVLLTVIWIAAMGGLVWYYVYQAGPLTETQQIDFLTYFLGSIVVFSIIAWVKCE
jgi:hypothetical protein